MLTQCPHCDATFKVTEKQLELAAGKVRCGACMQVFQADDNLVEVQDAAQVPHEDPEVFADGDDDELIQDGVDDFEHGYGKRRSPLKPVGTDDYSDAFVDDTFDYAHADEPDYADDSAADEAWAEDLLKESVSSEKSRENTETRVPAAAAPTEQFANYGADSHFGQSNNFDQLRADRPDHRPGRTTAGVDYRTMWLSVGGVALATILALLLLAQLAWLHFDKLAQRFPELIPIYQTFCDHAGCELPSIYQLDDIHSQDLVVRAHPVERNALVVDSIIVNKADIPQPYPDIQLEFSDANDRIIARRRFTPGEYFPNLDPEDAFMTPEAPLKIVLEIHDPGPAAVNYRLDFQPSAAYERLSQPKS
ncbi:DUF3426 domain-containing protein [Allohahella marinimesophila]|uniref:Zinc finger/thioredoxin putative domain-containing protein n=1 Tax=Allohahella marinimesophila TaxID=1054972 RepID=A0ABP7PJ48_9GAMM